MIPQEQADDARAIDAMASFAYSARRATSTINQELGRVDMDASAVNEWLVLRLMQIEGASALNKMAFELAIERPVMLRLASQMDEEGLIVFIDSPSVGRFQRTATITERGQTKLATYETKAVAAAEQISKALPKSRMIGFAKAVMGLARRLKQINKKAAA
ncbi:MAG: hypothetical protein Kilf2KO_11600 [Rhodospirillales bacterium]